MALPIGATPVLTGKEATEFLTALYRDEQKPVSPTPTPRLAEAEKLIKQYAHKRQEVNHVRTKDVQF